MKVIIALGNIREHTPVAHEDVLSVKNGGVTLPGQYRTNPCVGKDVRPRDGNYQNGPRGYLCGNLGQLKAVPASDPRPLAEIVAARLAAAGVTADDPGLQFIRTWNAERLAAAGVQPELEAGQ